MHIRPLPIAIGASVICVSVLVLFKRLCRERKVTEFGQSSVSSIQSGSSKLECSETMTDSNQANENNGCDQPADACTTDSSQCKETAVANGISLDNDVILLSPDLAKKSILSYSQVVLGQKMSASAKETDDEVSLICENVQQQLKLTASNLDSFETLQTSASKKSYAAAVACLSAASSPTQHLLDNLTTCSGSTHSVSDKVSEASNDSGKGASDIGHSSHESHDLSPMSGTQMPTIMYEFLFPRKFCGQLIGKQGKNIQQLMEKSNAHIFVRNDEEATSQYEIVVVEGTEDSVNEALRLIAKRFPQSRNPDVDLSLAPINTPLVFNPYSNDASSPPQFLCSAPQLFLPQGILVEVTVSCVQSTEHLFLHQITHPTYPLLQHLFDNMTYCYNNTPNIPGVCPPFENYVGAVVAAPSQGGWYRAMIISIDKEDAVVRFMDYGGYATVKVVDLKQMRSDFVNLPFQSVEVYLANITPLQKDGEYSEESLQKLQEWTNQQVLQAEIVGYADDAIPYVNLYHTMNGATGLLINSELANRELVASVNTLA